MFEFKLVCLSFLYPVDSTCLLTYAQLGVIFFQYELSVPGGIFANLPPLFYKLKNRLVMPNPWKLTCYEKWTALNCDVWLRDHYRCLEHNFVKTWKCRSQCFSVDSPGGVFIKLKLLLALKVGFNTTFLVSQFILKI